MNNFAARVMVSLTVAVLMMMVHKLSRAADYAWTAPQVTGTFSSAVAACQAYETQREAQYGWVYDHAVVGTTSADCYAQQGGPVSYRVTVTRSGTGCTSPKVYDSTTGACITPNTCPAAGTKFGSSSDVVWTSGATGLSFCNAGCVMTGSGAMGRSGSSGSYTEIFGPFATNHNQCDGSGSGGIPPMVTPPSLPATPPNPCPSGTTNIGVDSSGIPICSGTATPSPVTPQPTTTQQPQVTNADGSKTDVTTTTKTNADGSTTTTTTTKLTGTDGKVTSTTTSSTGNIPGTGGTGSVGGIGATPATKGKEDNPNDLCQQHPDLNVCKNSTVAGDCADTVCTGDAITCAMLRQQKKEYCENTVDNAQSTLGKAILGGTDSMTGQIQTAFTGTTVDLSSQSLDQTGWLGGGSCLPDRTITVMHHAVPVSFSALCNNITPLRYLVLACSLLAAYLLVSKSVLQG